MNIRTTRFLFFLVVLLFVSLSAVDGLAERTLVIQMGEAKCDTLSVSGKPTHGGYHVEEVWSQSQNEDVVSYSIDKDKGLICFEPLRWQCEDQGPRPEIRTRPLRQTKE